MNRQVMFFGEGGKWTLIDVKLQHQCPWCGTDVREGEHAIQQDRPDGGVNVCCKVLMFVRYPARVFRMDEVVDAPA